MKEERKKKKTEGMDELKRMTHFSKYTTLLSQLHRIEEDDERSLNLFFVFAYVSYICWRDREKV